MKKYVKTKEPEIKNSGLSHRYISASPRLTKWTLIIWAAVYIAINGLFQMRALSRAEARQTPSIPKKLQVPSPDGSDLTPEQIIAALKKEELELAESLMSDFPNSTYANMLMGNVLERHGDAVEAVKFMRKVLELDPKRPDVYKSIGWFAMQKGQYEQAIMNWRKALEVNPQIPNMHNSIALALLGLGKQKEAIEELKKDIQISPLSNFSYFMLGQVYLQLKEYSKAKENYKKAIAIQPNYTNAYYGLFTVCTRLKQRDKAREYMAIFRELKAEEMKNLKDRNEVFDDLVNMRKGAAETFMYVGQMYQTKQDLQRAEIHLKRAITLDPENTLYLEKLASFYQTKNRLPDALKLYTKVIEIEPQNLLCYLNIGILSTRLKQFNNAEKAFHQAITLAPKNSIGYRELAQLFLQTGTKLVEARKLAEKAVALEAIAINYFVLSWACDKNGDEANGLKAIEQAIKLEPNNSRYKKVYEYIKKKN
ncbi:MAG: tetratricopeptide repeat protein [Planctomycetes bacterium]|nr:tetratricopeptide repeat protein [Planctomycetota bacterium]